VAAERRCRKARGPFTNLSLAALARWSGEDRSGGASGALRTRVASLLDGGERYPPRYRLGLAKSRWDPRPSATTRPRKEIKVAEPQELYTKGRRKSVSDFFDLTDPREVRRLLVILNAFGGDYCNFTEIDVTRYRVKLTIRPGGAAKLQEQPR
jgi:hypothetical protein